MSKVARQKKAILLLGAKSDLLKPVVNKRLLPDIFSLFATNSVDMFSVINDPILKIANTAEQSSGPKGMFYPLSIWLPVLHSADTEVYH